VTNVTTGGTQSTFATGFSTPEGLVFGGNRYIAGSGNNTVSYVGPGSGAATRFVSGFNGSTFITNQPDVIASPAPSSLMLLEAGSVTLAVGAY
jgi:hypothetical protein